MDEPPKLIEIIITMCPLVAFLRPFQTRSHYEGDPEVSGWRL